MNRTYLSGRLGHTPELRSTASGKKVVNTSLAVYAGKSATGEPLTEWFDVVLWGEQAEQFASRAHKGDTIVIEGNARKRKRAKDGVEYETVEFVASIFWVQPKAPMASNAMPDDDDYPF